MLILLELKAMFSKDKFLCFKKITEICRIYELQIAPPPPQYNIFTVS